MPSSTIDFLRLLHKSRVEFSHLSEVEAVLQITDRGKVIESKVLIYPQVSEASLSSSNGVSYHRFSDGILQITYPDGKKETVDSTPMAFDESLKLFYHEELELWGRGGVQHSGLFSVDSVEIRETRLSNGSVYQDPIGRAWLHRIEDPEVKAICEIDGHFGLRLFAEFNPDGTLLREYRLLKINYDGILYDAEVAPAGFPFPNETTLRK